MAPIKPIRGAGILKNRPELFQSAVESITTSWEMVLIDYFSQSTISME